MNRTILALVAVALALAACHKKPASRRDPVRIISLTPTTTEIVAALGVADRLVGVDDYSTYPDAVRSLPKVGSFLRPDPEAILRLKPDLVIADDIHTEAAAALRDSGVEVLLVSMHDLPDLRLGFTRIGERLGLAKVAAERVEAMQAAIEAASARRAGKGRHVLIVIDREHGGLGNMVGAADGSWLDELVAITGADNVLAGSATRYPRVSPEMILRGKPDLILDASYEADPGPWAELRDIPAVASGRVRILRDPYFLGPSPRVAEALAGLEAAMAP